MSTIDHFYLTKVFPEADKVFGFDFKGIGEIKSEAVFIFDTNVLLVPYLTGKESIKDYERIFTSLKDNNRLFIPSRVAREFANNRGENLATIFRRIHEALDRLNKADFTLGDYTVLETNEDYQKAQEIEHQINSLKEQYRTILKSITTHVQLWNWDDPISKLYRKIFTSDLIVEVQKPDDELVKDLNFRKQYNIAPGYKDSKKPDEGIGDLIIWQTVLEIGKEMDKDIIFVTNEKKNDWFHIQENTALYPKYELFDEFRRFTNGHSIAIISFPEFLALQQAEQTTIEQATEQSKELIAPSGFTVIDTETFLKHLFDCEATVRNRENSFVGCKFFVENYLKNKGFDIGSSWEKLHELENMAIVETYSHIDKYGNYPPLRALRRK
jgi:hypothetical protein